MQTGWLSWHVKFHLNKSSPLSPCQGLPAHWTGGGTKIAFSKEGEHLILLFLYSFLQKKICRCIRKDGSGPPCIWRECKERIMLGGFGLHSALDIQFLYLHVCVHACIYFFFKIPSFEIQVRDTPKSLLFPKVAGFFFFFPSSLYLCCCFTPTAVTLGS